MSPCHLEGFAFAGRGATASRPFAAQVTMSRASLSAFIISVHPRTPRSGAPTSYLPCQLAHRSTGQLTLPLVYLPPATGQPINCSTCLCLFLINRASGPPSLRASLHPLPAGQLVNGPASCSRVHLCTFARGSAAVAPLHRLHLISSPPSGQLANRSTGQLTLPLTSRLLRRAYLCLDSVRFLLSLRP